jgi:hypothetical protein
MGTLKIGAAADRHFHLARDSEIPRDLLLLGQSEICCLLIRVSFDYTALLNKFQIGFHERSFNNIATRPMGIEPILFTMSIYFFLQSLTYRKLENWRAR